MTLWLYACAYIYICICIYIHSPCALPLPPPKTNQHHHHTTTPTTNRWHGKAGLVLYDLSMLTVATGLLKSLHPTLVTFGLLVHLCALWCVAYVG